MRNLGEVIGTEFANLSRPVDHDDSVGQLYQVFTIPTVLFIEEDGIIRAKIVERVTPEILEEKLPLIGVDP